MEINETVVTVAVFLGTGLAAYVGYFMKAKPPEKHLEVAGALVDESSVKELAAAIDRHTNVAKLALDAGEKRRQIGYRMVEKIEKLTDEVEELRRVVGDGANELARRR